MIEKTVYFIGGSPCSGKSTIAEMFAREYGMYYFKVDDYLEKYMRLAAEKGRSTCKKSIKMKPDEIWMRDALVQCDEEFRIYEEIAEFVFEDLQRIDAKAVITEGAAYTPTVMKHSRSNGYISIVPTAEFQVSHYKEREWVPYVLEGCSDKVQAFENWMQRDILFAERVKEECRLSEIPCIVNDGTKTPPEIFCMVKELLGLRKKIK